MTLPPVALALLEHLPAGGARHQPGLRDVGVHHVEEILGLLVDDLRHLVDAGRDHEDVDAAERLHRGIDDPVAIGFRRSAAPARSRPCRRACAHSCATLSSASAPPAEITTLAPAPASTFAAIAPNAPDAPVTMAVLPFTLNSDSGIFQKIVGHVHHLAHVHSLPPRSGASPESDASQTRGLSDSRAREPSLAAPRMTELMGCASQHHFTGATATAMVQTSWPRLTISRLSFGPM